MSVSNCFDTFCSNLRMRSTTVSTIQSCYKLITKQINIDYYGTTSETSNSFYVGSYGRGTEIFISDIDIIVILPYATYSKFKGDLNNGQSALLQELRDVIKKIDPTAQLSRDGQVVVLKFNDDIRCKIVPVFKNKDGSYTYPETNNGGSWKMMNPKAEIDEINRANTECNKNLKRLCRMGRAWKSKWSVPISGLLIDTLAYNFMKNWTHKDKSYLNYDFMSRDFFEYLKNQDPKKSYWLAPGNNQRVYRTGKFEDKAKQCYTITFKAIQKEKDSPYTAKLKWREIYGTKFPC